jgi:hypothetical protein
MSKSADYTIKGFIYQFNKTIMEILSASADSVITVEGIVEDIDIVAPQSTTAIQCKYHEAKEKFTLSAIYKPLLQMMDHYHKNQSSNIRYVLFSHFPDHDDNNPIQITKKDLETAIASTNADYQSITARLKNNIDLNKFLAQFCSHPGPTFDELAKSTYQLLETAGFDSADVDALAYPNAISFIADLSTKHAVEERQITKIAFIEKLKSIKKTTVSRWTMALKTKKNILEARKKQLKFNLDQNTRLRHILVNASSFPDYTSGIVLFINDFLDKYHFKSAHISTPVFCLNTTESDLKEVHHRLVIKRIIATDGFEAGTFHEERFFRDPLVKKEKGGKVIREFSLRLMRWEDNGEILSKHKCDDLYVIGELNLGNLDLSDINIEQLGAETLQEIKYLMGVSNVYE